MAPSQQAMSYSSSPAATPTKNYTGHGRLSFAAQNFSGINLPLTEGGKPTSSAQPSHSKRHSDGSIDPSKLKSKADGGSSFQHNKRRQQRPRRRQTVMEAGGPGQDMRKSFLGLPNITPFRRLSLDEDKVKSGK